MKLLVIRTSAMGDAALTVPVLKAMREQFPDTEIIMLTRPLYWAFFTSLDGIQLVSVDFNNRHKGLKGLYFLFKDLQKLGKIDTVIDLHDVLRSKVLRFLFRLQKANVFKIDKGRSAKRKVIRGKLKTGLKHSVERYLEVFQKAGFNVVLKNGPWIIPSPDALKTAVNLTDESSSRNIGIAPYAKHQLKAWPVEYMTTLMAMISKKYDVKFWLFGGRDEYQNLEKIKAAVPGSVNLAGKLQFYEELAVISKLDLMISMDSSNMHMAALTGTKVISIWGATDPITGFGAWGQPGDYSVSIPFNELTCRPCTVFGKGECRRKDHACMNWLKPEIVFERLESLEIL